MISVMKKGFYILLMGLVLLTAMSCGKDDTDTVPVPLEKYILGTWHSYKMDAYANGQKAEVDITKNNEYSSVYIEMTFRDDNIVDMGYWLPNDDGTSRWTTESDYYYIHNNIVQICEQLDNDSENGWDNGLSFETTAGGSFLTRGSSDSETVTMMYDNASKSLYVRYSTVVNGANVVGNLYFRK